MPGILRIGTRDSQLAVWQATLVQNLLKENGVPSDLIYIKSEGDIDTITPLYALGVTGIFTKTLDAALLNNRIDIAVHSMKDVPTQLAKGIKQAAVLQRASYKDILVPKNDAEFLKDFQSMATIATSSIRRISQWLNRYPNHTIENLRGNVNTRLRKVSEHQWQGAIFAAAGLERIDLRPEKSVDLDWMLPAPAQGAIMIVCREDDNYAFECSHPLNHEDTALCTKIERDFLNTLMGGCSTPISALAQRKNDKVFFRGNICSKNGQIKSETASEIDIETAATAGVRLANEILKQPSASKIVQDIRNAKK